MTEKSYDHIEVYKGWFRLPSLDWVRISDVERITPSGFRLDKSMVVLKNGARVIYNLSCRSIIGALTEK